jgi:DNA-binding protein YbaB
VAVASDHQARVDELLAEYRRSREELAGMQRSLAAISESVTSSDGLVKATVGAHGTLTDLAIADAAYVRLSPSDLARLVVRTAATAAVRASETANRTVSPLLPVQADPAAMLAGRADLSPAELAPSDLPPGGLPLGPPKRADDESFEDLTWMEGRQS